MKHIFPDSRFSTRKHAIAREARRCTRAVSAAAVSNNFATTSLYDSHNVLVLLFMLLQRVQRQYNTLLAFKIWKEMWFTCASAFPFETKQWTNKVVQEMENHSIFLGKQFSHTKQPTPLRPPPKGNRKTVFVLRKLHLRSNGRSNGPQRLRIQILWMTPVQPTTSPSPEKSSKANIKWTIYTVITNKTKLRSTQWYFAMEGKRGKEKSGPDKLHWTCKCDALFINFSWIVSRIKEMKNDRKDAWDSERISHFRCE